MLIRFLNKYFIQTDKQNDYFVNIKIVIKENFLSWKINNLVLGSRSIRNIIFKVIKS